MSFKYTRANCYFTVVRIVAMVRWYVAGAFFSPHGMRVNAYIPRCVVSVVSSRYFDAIKICQYPELTLRVMKIFASLQLSIHSSILGIGYESRTVMAFRHL